MIPEIHVESPNSGLPELSARNLQGITSCTHVKDTTGLQNHAFRAFGSSFVAWLELQSGWRRSSPEGRDKALRAMVEGFRSAGLAAFLLLGFTLWQSFLSLLATNTKLHLVIFLGQVGGK